MSLDRAIIQSADQLRQAVRDSGISLAEISRRSGVHAVTLSRWMHKRPRGNLSASKMDDVARAIGKTFDTQVRLK